MADTRDLQYNANDVEVRNDDIIVLKPKWCYEWYPDEIKDETRKLRKFYKLKLSFHRTITETCKITNEFHVVVEGDHDIRSSPSKSADEIHNVEDLRKLISEALFRVSHFDVGEIPPSLRRGQDKKWDGYKYLTVSITDPETCSSLFSREWLEKILQWIKGE